MITITIPVWVVVLLSSLIAINAILSTYKKYLKIKKELKKEFDDISWLFIIKEI